MRRGKYNVAPAEERTIDNIVFDSKREMQYYANLKLLERAGIVRDIERQVPFTLFGGERVVPICKYVADFTYYDKDGKFHVVDAKGMKTAMYRLKAKWFSVCYPNLRIEEV